MEGTKQTKAEIAKAKKAERNRLAYQKNKDAIAEKNAERKEEIAKANKKRYDKESDELQRLLLLKNAGDEEAKDLYFDIKDKRSANFSNYYFEHAEEIYRRKQENKDKPKRPYDKSRMDKIREAERERAHKQYNSKHAKQKREEYEKNAYLEGIQKLKEEQERREKQEEEEKYSKKDLLEEHEQLIKERPTENIVLAISEETPTIRENIREPIREPIRELNCNNIHLVITEKDVKKELPKTKIKIRLAKDKKLVS